MTDVLDARTITVNASAAATAWLNAFLATGQDEERPILYRTLSVEFFRDGVHFVACDGTLLFRTWVPKEEDADWPVDEEVPERAVVVMDGGHFALGFVRTLLAATKGLDIAEIQFAIELAPEADGEVPLGANFSAEVLTLRALGQQLHCRLYEAPYVDWRQLKFGLDQAERVDGMKLATRMFSAVGKLKAIGAIECTFTGAERRIALAGDRSFRGVLMPMRRAEKDRPAPTSSDDEQVDALDDSRTTEYDVMADAKVKIGNEWVPATQENVARAAGFAGARAPR